MTGRPDGPEAPARLALTVITGLSGAGKSQAVATFEDKGYFCIDNLPVQMLPRVVELFSLEGSRVDKVALVFDVRGRHYFKYLEKMLAELGRLGVPSRVLFLDASDDVLVARFQLTRRSHPLSPDDRLVEGIREERLLLSGLRERADVVIDTSDLNVHELKWRIQDALLAGELIDKVSVTFLSFGYKFGLPTEADIVLDARFLPNPYWVEELRPLTGLDASVKDYAIARPETHGFIERAASLLIYLVPLYLAVRRTRLIVAVGCTGGRHRSVALAEAFAARLAKEPHIVAGVRHRDLERMG